MGLFLLHALHMGTCGTLISCKVLLRSNMMRREIVIIHFLLHYVWGMFLG